METKKSVVTAIQENVRQYTGQNGVTYYHTISFANGDTGQYGSKSAKCEKFTINKEADYTIETKVNGSYTNYVIKPAQQTGVKFGSQPKNEKLIVAQSCIGYATQLYMGKQTDTETVLEVAEKFYKWALEKGGVE